MIFNKQRTAVPKIIISFCSSSPRSPFSLPYPIPTQALYRAEYHLDVVLSALDVLFDFVYCLKGVDEGVDVVVERVAVLFEPADLFADRLVLLDHGLVGLHEMLESFLVSFVREPYCW